MSVPTIRAGALRLPAVGLGTFGFHGLPGRDGLVAAIRNGYRLLDSGARYENEAAVGSAVRRSGVDRGEVVVTTKLPGAMHARDRVLPMVEESLLRTGLDVIDLYLIHWPNPIAGRYVEAWAGLLEARSKGLVREVGVCNFLPEHLDRIAAETGVLPAVNQIEMHPWFPQVEQRAYHERHGIVTEAWTPLGRRNAMLQDPVIVGVAAAYGVSPAQAVLRWHLQLGAVPLPRSLSAERQRQNLDLWDFELDDDEVGRFTALGRADGRIENQDPALHQEF